MKSSGGQEILGYRFRQRSRVDLSVKGTEDVDLGKIVMLQSTGRKARLGSGLHYTDLRTRQKSMTICHCGLLGTTGQPIGSNC